MPTKLKWNDYFSFSYGGGTLVVLSGRLYNPRSALEKNNESSSLKADGKANEEARWMADRVVLQRLPGATVSNSKILAGSSFPLFSYHETDEI